MASIVDNGNVSAILGSFVMFSRFWLFDSLLFKQRKYMRELVHFDKLYKEFFFWLRYAKLSLLFFN